MNKDEQIHYLEYYNKLTKTEQKEYLQKIKEKINKESDENPLFSKMLRIVNKELKMFHADFLLHDYNILTIESEGRKEFFWMTRDSGTHLIHIDDFFEEDIKRNKDYLEMLDEHFKYESTRYFYINTQKQEIKNIRSIKYAKNKMRSIYGEVDIYFDKKNEQQIKDNDNYVNRSIFNKLMSEYRNNPPKKEIDNIFR